MKKMMNNHLGKCVEEDMIISKASGNPALNAQNDNNFLFNSSTIKNCRAFPNFFSFLFPSEVRFPLQQEGLDLFAFLPMYSIYQTQFQMINSVSQDI